MENPNPIDRKDMLYKSEIWNELYATHVPVWTETQFNFMWCG
jgi:hypothetical protein